MGWNISHHLGADDMRRSYTSIHNLGQQIAHVLAARDWRHVRSLFSRSCDPFTVPPKDAGQMARILTAAADHPQAPEGGLMDSECQLCGAPGGYPYCNEDCRVADMDEAEYQAYIKPGTN